MGPAVRDSRLTPLIEACRFNTNSVIPTSQGKVSLKNHQDIRALSRTPINSLAFLSKIPETFSLEFFRRKYSSAIFKAAKTASFCVSTMPVSLCASISLFSTYSASEYIKSSSPGFTSTSYVLPNIFTGTLFILLNLHRFSRILYYTNSPRLFYLCGGVNPCDKKSVYIRVSLNFYCVYSF